MHECLSVQECLFPPCTMLEVVRMHGSRGEASGGDAPSRARNMPEPAIPEAEERFGVRPDGDESGKTFISIDVLPHFL